MYPPSHFTESRPEILLQVMRENSFATVVTAAGGVPVRVARARVDRRRRRRRRDQDPRACVAREPARGAARGQRRGARDLPRPAWLRVAVLVRGPAERPDLELRHRSRVRPRAAARSVRAGRAAERSRRAARARRRDAVALRIAARGLRREAHARDRRLRDRGRARRGQAEVEPEPFQRGSAARARTDVRAASIRRRATSPAGWRV